MEGLEQQAALGQQLIFESRLMETQIAEQKKHSQLMVEHMAELRRQRHDLRHQLTAIRGLAGDTNPQLSKYIDDLLDTIPAIDPKKSSKIKYLQVAPMFAEAIERIYQEISISKLFR